MYKVLHVNNTTVWWTPRLSGAKKFHTAAECFAPSLSCGGKNKHTNRLQ